MEVANRMSVCFIFQEGTCTSQELGARIETTYVRCALQNASEAMVASLADPDLPVPRLPREHLEHMTS